MFYLWFYVSLSTYIIQLGANGPKWIVGCVSQLINRIEWYWNLSRRWENNGDKTDTNYYKTRSTMAESLFLVYFRLVLLQSIYAAFIELIEYRYSRECAFGVQFGHVNFCTTSWSDDRNRHTRTIRILALNQSNAAESSCKDTTIMDNSCLYHRRCWFWFVIYSTVQFVTIRWTEIYLGF